MTINQPIMFVYSCWQRTVRNDRCVTRTALSVTGGRFWPAAVWTDIPYIQSKSKVLLLLQKLHDLKHSHEPRVNAVNNVCM